MAKQAPSPFPFPPKRVYWGADIPLRVIRRYARAIAEEFRPDKIILFGSHAYGTPHADSDVDLLVIMPARNPSSQAGAYSVSLVSAVPSRFAGLHARGHDLAVGGERVIPDDRDVPGKSPV